MSKTLKTIVTTAALGTAFFMSMQVATANSPRNNAEQVEDVTLSQKGINIHVVLRNKAVDKHVNSVDIQPEKSSMNIPFQGLVKCKKSKKVDFTGARAYFGTVSRSGNSIEKVNSLYDATYHPSFATWTGLIGGWITEAGNYDPFVVPLNKVKNGHPAVRFDPVALFNEKLQSHINGGGSKLDFLKNDQSVTVNRPVSLAGTCREAESYSKSTHGSGYITVSMPLTILYKGDANLHAAIANNSPNQFASEFQVSSASVTPFVKDYVGQCPVYLKFRVAFKTQGVGDVKFRLISEQGAKGSVKTIKVSKNDNGTKIFDFTRSIGEVKQGGIDDKNIAIPQQNGGNINQFAQNPTTKKSGSWRVELVEPKSMVSEESFYSWKCEMGKGPSQIKASKPKRADPKPVIPEGLQLKTK
jgi:hypothetical protein